MSNGPMDTVLPAAFVFRIPPVKNPPHKHDGCDLCDVVTEHLIVVRTMPFWHAPSGQVIPADFHLCKECHWLLRTGYHETLKERCEPDPAYRQIFGALFNDFLKARL